MHSDTRDQLYIRSCINHDCCATVESARNDLIPVSSEETNPQIKRKTKKRGKPAHSQKIKSTTKTTETQLPSLQFEDTIVRVLRNGRQYNSADFHGIGNSFSGVLVHLYVQSNVY